MKEMVAQAMQQMITQTVGKLQPQVWQMARQALGGGNGQQPELQGLQGELQGSQGEQTIEGLPG